MNKKSAAQERPQPQQELLDGVFFALSDPVRRGIVEHLQSGPLLVSELAGPFSISIQAISRHIQVLEDAGLVQKERSGRIRRCSLDVGPILDVVAWLNRYSRYCQGQFAQLSAMLAPSERARVKASAPEFCSRADPRASTSARPSRNKARSARSSERRASKKPR